MLPLPNWLDPSATVSISCPAMLSVLTVRLTTCWLLTTPSQSCQVSMLLANWMPTADSGPIRNHIHPLYTLPHMVVSILTMCIVRTDCAGQTGVLSWSVMQLSKVALRRNTVNVCMQLCSTSGSTPTITKESVSHLQQHQISCSCGQCQGYFPGWSRQSEAINMTPPSNISEVCTYGIDKPTRLSSCMAKSLDNNKPTG